ncbi:MAG: cytochrome c biogenesis protein CcsA [Anaerolineae bacterium]|nr:cytochrome c biogenesis protein CcsA [Anaerolineae bacterium]
MEYADNRNFWLRVMTYISMFLLVAATIMSFTYPGTERSMGEVQRLFYIHLGSFFGSFLTFLTAVVAGIYYLRTRDAKWDRLELASIEIGLGLSTVTIVTGAIWARPTWGTYWTWDPRLTTIAIMWLTYAAYLFLRSAIEDPERKRRFAAVYAIIAFSSVILTIIIIRVRPDVIHPTVAGPSVTSSDVQGEFNVTPRIRDTVFFNIFAYCVLSAVLTWHRIRLENKADWIQERKLAILGNM